MNRLPEQLVAWHNRHPLARRIAVKDVHTVGVVALPFMRSASKAAAAASMPARMIEPVLDGAAAAEPVQPPISPEGQARTQPASSRWKFWLRDAADPSAGLQSTWPVFSESFVDGLSVRSISRFTQASGFAIRPGEATWPTREVAIDDTLVAPANAASGAWPVELFLVSAAIDASEKSRTRVLIGQNQTDDTLAVLGRRCLSPLRVGGLAAALLLLVGGAAAALWWPHGEAAQDAAAPVAATAPSAPSAASASFASSASSASSAAAASPAESAASAPMAASEPAPTPVADAASEPPPDIRPRLVERVLMQRARQPTRAMLAPADPASAAVAVPPPAAASKPLEKVAEAKPEKAAAKAMPGSIDSGINKGNNKGNNGGNNGKMNTSLNNGKPVVALVGPPSANKADAEALLERLRAAVAGVQGASNTALQAAVFQTPEGWRAAVWPFGSREEAQIINATLVARGMRTRAVDF